MCTIFAYIKYTCIIQSTPIRTWRLGKLSQKGLWIVSKNSLEQLMVNLSNSSRCFRMRLMLASGLTLMTSDSHHPHHECPRVMNLGRGTH